MGNPTLEYIHAGRILYAACLEPVCRKYGLARTELDILMFLANNPQHDTAAAVVELRFLAKSHVSTSVKALERAGLLEKYQLPGDRRAVHLRVLPAAAAVADGQAAQERFRSALNAGLSGEELRTLEKCAAKLTQNIKNCMEELKHAD